MYALYLSSNHLTAWVQDSIVIHSIYGGTEKASVEDGIPFSVNNTYMQPF